VIFAAYHEWWKSLSNLRQSLGQLINGTWSMLDERHETLTFIDN
jgi:hypothetical protein